MAIVTPLGYAGTGSVVPGGNATAPTLTPTPAPPPPTSQPVPQTILDFNKANGPSTTSPTGKDVFGNPVVLPQTSTPTTGTSADTSGTSDAQTKLTADQQKYQDNANALADQGDAFNTQIQNIQSGATPLTTGEQAQIDGLKAQYDTWISDQLKQNSAAQGTAQVRGFQVGAAEYDPFFQAKTIGSIISAGTAKVQDLQVKEASAVAQLTQALRDNDVKAVQNAWQMTQDTAKIRQDALQKMITDTQAAIKDAQDAKIAADKVTYDTVTKPMQDIAADAQKNGAPAEVVSAINAAKTVADAATAAAGWLQTATGTLGDYLQYKRDAEAKGLTPLDYQTYLDKQKAQDQTDKINLAYATKKAEAQAQGDYTSSPKVQQALEQQYRGVLAKEFSARTGALGVENSKVNQANHLNALVKSYYDPKTGNYNIPTAQYAELAIGLANMVSGTGQSSDADRAEIKSKTAAGDLKGALQYITGSPQNGNTQAIIKNLVDSIDRQAETAIRNRQAALDDMKAQAPTDLDPARVAALNQSTKMVGYEGQDRISKANVDNYVKSNPSEAEAIAKLYEVPGATDQDIEDYLRAQGKLQ